MSAQLTYPQSPAIGFQGMIAQNFAVKQIDSGLVETAALGLGYAVVNGTADNHKKRYKTPKHTKSTFFYTKAHLLLSSIFAIELNQLII